MIVRISWRSLVRSWRRAMLLSCLIAVPLALAVMVLTLSATAEGSPQRQVQLSFGAASGKVVFEGSDLAISTLPARARSGTQQIESILGTASQPRTEFAGPADLTSPTALVQATVLGTDVRRVQELALRFHLDQGSYPSNDRQIAISRAVRDALRVDLGSAIKLSSSVSVQVSGVYANPIDTNVMSGLVGSDPADEAIAAWEEARPGAQAAVTLEWFVQGSVPLPNQTNMLSANTLAYSDVLPSSIGPDPVRDPLVALLLPASLVLLLLAGVLASSGFSMSASQLRQELGLAGVLGLHHHQRTQILVMQGTVVGAVAAVLAAGFGAASAALITSPMAGWFGQIWGGLQIRFLPLAVIAGAGIATGALASWAAGRSTARLDPLVAIKNNPAHISSEFPRTARRWLILCGTLAAVSAAGLWVTGAQILVVWCGFLLVIAVVAAVRLSIPLLARVSTSFPLMARLASKSMTVAPARITAQIAIVGAVVLIGGMVAVLFGSLTQKMEDNRGQVVPPGAVSLTSFGPQATDFPGAVGDALGRPAPPIAISLAVAPGSRDDALLTANNSTLECLPQAVGRYRDCQETALTPEGLQFSGVISSADVQRLMGRTFTPAESEHWNAGGALLLADVDARQGFIELNSLDGGDPQWVPARTVSSPGPSSGSEIPNVLVPSEHAAAVGMTSSNATTMRIYVSATGLNPGEDQIAAANALIRSRAGDGAQLYVERGAPAAHAIGYIYLGSVLVMALVSLVVLVLSAALLRIDLRQEWRLLWLQGVSSRRRRLLMSGVMMVCAAVGAVVGLIGVLLVSPGLTAAAGGPWSAEPFAVIGSGAVGIVLLAGILGVLRSPRIDTVRRPD